MDMLNTPKEIVIDEPEMDKKTLANLTKGVPARKTRKGDNPKGDNKIIPSATKAESYVRPNSMDSMINAVKYVTSGASIVEDMDKVHTVDIDHTTGEAGSHEKKHGITLKKNGSTSSSSLTTDATGTKANLQKYLKKHYDGDHEEMHPEIYK